MARPLPVVSGNCPTCHSDTVSSLSRSPATGEVMLHCAECGEQWWEEDRTDPLHEMLEEDKAA